jgi:hypothetical protein
MYNLPKEEAGNLSPKDPPCWKDPPWFRLFKSFRMPFLAFFLRFQYVVLMTCRYVFMDGKMTYVFYGFEYVFFMVLNVIFDFDRSW